MKDKMSNLYLPNSVYSELKKKQMEKAKYSSVQYKDISQSLEKGICNPEIGNLNQKKK